MDAPAPNPSFLAIPSGSPDALESEPGTSSIPNVAGAGADSETGYMVQQSPCSLADSPQPIIRLCSRLWNDLQSQWKAA